MRRSSLAPIFIAAVMASAAPAQTTLPTFGDVPVYDPTCRIPLSVQDLSLPFAVSPNGDTIYLATSATAINITEVALAAWRWAGPWVGGLVVLAYLLLLWRVRRSPRVPGAPHCRYCDYCLHGQTAPRCPECGRPTDRPRFGRTPWQRLRLATHLSLTTLILAAAVWIPGAAHWVGQRAAWWSTALQGSAKLGLNLSAFVRPMTRITSRAPCSDHVICEASLPGRASEMYATPDGTGLLVLSGACWLFDAATLRPVRSIAPPHFDGNARSWEQVIGFDADQNKAWLSATGDHGVVRVYACDLGSGATRRVLQVQYRHPRQNMVGSFAEAFWNRRIEVVQLQGRRVVIDSPLDSVEVSEESREATMVPFRVWAADGSEELIREFGIRVSPWTWPVVREDRMVAFCDEQVHWFDLLGRPTGSRELKTALGGRVWFSPPVHFKVGLGPTPTLFGIIGRRGQRSIGLVDAETGAWRALLRVRDNETPNFCSFASHAQVAAIKVVVLSGQGNLLIYDRRDTATATAPSSASQPADPANDGRSIR